MDEELSLKEFRDRKYGLQLDQNCRQSVFSCDWLTHQVQDATIINAINKTFAKWIMRKYLSDMNPVEAIGFINDRFKQIKQSGFWFQ
jgi:transcription termination factor Rho